jgi:hypothetical protein
MTGQCPAPSEVLTGEQWELLLNQTVLYATGHVARWYWRGSLGGLLPDGYDPNAIAALVISEWLESPAPPPLFVGPRYPGEGGTGSFDQIRRELERLVRKQINRLHHRMPLGIDATVRYGFHVPGTQSLLESQLNSDNPYNTRKLLGLPPTPIANPGLASIQAAAHPVAGDWLYFVRKPDKVHHFFTASERDFINYKNAHGF